MQTGVPVVPDEATAKDEIQLTTQYVGEPCSIVVRHDQRELSQQHQLYYRADAATQDPAPQTLRQGAVSQDYSSDSRRKRTEMNVINSRIPIIF